MLLCVILFWPSKIENSLSLMQNVFEVWELKENCFWKIWVEFKCFWKTFHFILMHFIHKTMCFEDFFSLKCSIFQKKLIFPNFQPIEPVARSIKIAIKILVWPIFFFMHHFYLGFTCFALFFLYPSCSFAIISLIVFTHNMHTLC